MIPGGFPREFTFWKSFILAWSPDNAKVEFSLRGINTGYLNTHRITQAEYPARSSANDGMGNLIDVVVIARQVGKMHKTFGRKFNSLAEEPKAFHAGNCGVEFEAHLIRQVANEPDFYQFPLGFLGSTFGE